MIELFEGKTFFDNKKRTIGKKRDEMLKLAQGKYVTFVDDDDRISDDYVDEIMNGGTGESHAIHHK